MKTLLNRVLQKINNAINNRPKNSSLAFSQLFLLVTGFWMLIFEILPTGVTINTYNANLKLDLNSNFPLVLNQSQPEIKLVQSKYERQLKNAGLRNVAPRVAFNRAEGVSFDQKRALAKQTAEKYGIDWKILEAVWQVESGKSWDTGKKSYAGATGPMQFMPGTFRAYAEDGDGDGKAIISDANDALASAAKMLSANGLSEGNADKALYNYNHSLAYVSQVKSIANSIVD